MKAPSRSRNNARAFDVVTLISPRSRAARRSWTRRTTSRASASSTLSGYQPIPASKYRIPYREVDLRSSLVVLGSHLSRVAQIAESDCARDYGMVKCACPRNTDRLAEAAPYLRSERATPQRQLNHEFVRVI